MKLSRITPKTLTNFAYPVGDGVFCKRMSSTRSSNPFQEKDSDVEGVGDAIRARKQALVDKFWKASAKYEEFIGLADVLRAQKRVKKAEKEFTEARATERAIMREMVETREKLKDIRERLSHVDYSNTMYLQLASDQHELVNKETRQKRELEEIEERERDSFLELSTAMRESYEHERARVERTKNWSIIGTVMGTIIGMIGAIYMNRVRTKELLKAVKEHGGNVGMEERFEEVNTNFVFKAVKIFVHVYIQIFELVVFQLVSEIDKTKNATVGALTNVADNLSEMSNAVQVQNLQVMAGFVEESMREDQENKTENKSKVGGSKVVTPVPTASIQTLSEEISSYNVALNSLVNAVTALTHSSVGQAETAESAQSIERLLKEQINTFSTLRMKMDEIHKTARRNDWTAVSSKLDLINRKLSSLTAPQAGADAETPVIYELPPEIEPEYRPDWKIGMKDAVLWGSLLCCLYMFIKF